MALALLLLIADSQRWAPLADFREKTYSFFEPVFLAIAWPGSVIDEMSDSLRFGSILRADNQRLKQQNLILAARVQKLSYLASDNARLRGLIASASQLRSRVLVGEVIGIDPDPSRHVLIINQGLRAGLYQGQPVLDSRGVFGRVVQVGRHTSRVMLVTDRQHSVPVRINRNGMRAILSGTGDTREMRLQYVPEKSDIKTGDLLVTSGLGQDFPAGYPVGHVGQIRRLAGDQFLDIAALPVAALDRSRYVLILFEKPAANDAQTAVAELPALTPVEAAASPAAAAPTAAPASTPAIPAAPAAAAVPTVPAVSPRQEESHAQTP